MKWDAVDLDVGALTVRTSLASTRAKKTERAAGAAAVVLKGTKSGKSRQVPLDAPTKAFREIADVAELPREVSLHSVPSTTLNLYSHVVAGGREKAVAAASDTLRRAKATHAASGK